MRDCVECSNLSPAGRSLPRSQTAKTPLARRSKLSRILLCSTTRCHWLTASRQPARLGPAAQDRSPHFHDARQRNAHSGSPESRSARLFAQDRRQATTINAIEALASHKPFFSAKISEALLDLFIIGPTRHGSALTNRERGVVQLIAEGHTNKQIAAVLTISLKTVETHRATVMRKLHLSSSAALVRYAIRSKLVEA